MCFDGANIWIVNFASSAVTKVDASTGTVVGEYTSGGSYPQGICYDGANIWVANRGNNTVSKF